MIKSEFVIKNNLFQSFYVKGHANFDKYNKDLVCSAVTSIVSGSLNGFDILYKDDLELIVDNNRISVNIINNCSEIQLLISFIFIQLETVAVQYPKYFSLKKVGE
ncbi:hypothetical protein SCORR_v1c08290 [Spiroplasma corruscae]|uniref:Ribosomal processing cysteine protease Prp n=1 Tax=Spiroplasma corruscae TaxID=216934 RepID=A0A222EQC5_9MOLU|nr:ribosomal-processing cysteine protease Prp [Spiroplasma corruscae]ASP28601.1 hypothetical protein SCORR_v1c08290 [Spiroplasma corruscae]